MTFAAVVPAVHSALPLWFVIPGVLCTVLAIVMLGAALSVGRQRWQVVALVLVAVLVYAASVRASAIWTNPDIQACGCWLDWFFGF